MLKAEELSRPMTAGEHQRTNPHMNALCRVVPVHHVHFLLPFIFSIPRVMRSPFYFIPVVVPATKRLKVGVVWLLVGVVR